ncbi:hypothetical protein IAU60_000766 [Kwoniella sp. DSM 27419]
MAPNIAGPSSAPLKKEKGRKGKAGGPGKKGKVFVEGKADLLSLISGITSSKDAETESKVAKRRAVMDSQESADSQDKAKKSKKASERDKALASAKAALKEKERLKKKRKEAVKNGAGVNGAEAEAKPKKRVGFA